MAFQVSPGVEVKEVDLTNVIPAASTSIGAYAGTFNWGPVEEITLISNEKELVNTFGAPIQTSTNNNQASFYTAASFLKYGNALKVVRASSASAKNAVTGGGSGYLIKNRTAYDSFALPSGSTANFAAKFPGTLGNSLKISICVDSTGFTTWAYKSYFSAAPGTSAAAAAVGSSNDELHIVIVDEDGAFTGAPNTLLEKFAFVSQAKDALKEDGTSNYYVNVLNETSKYVWWLKHPTGLAEAGTALFPANNFYVTANSETITASFAGGVDTSCTPGNIETALNFFADPETVDINLLFTEADIAGSADNTLAEAVITIAESRKDCMAFASPPIAYTVGEATPLTAVTAWADGISSTSYAVLDSTAVKVYDKYNDVYLWISASGHIAGLCAKTDKVSEPWFSPAGVSRGAILGVTKLAFNPNAANRDELFKKRINPLVSFPGQGIILYGDKTALAKPSAFDAINVRRLFITLEKAISTAAKAQLFEFNDDFTRAAFRNATEPFLRQVKGRRGITDFKVVCDTTNNTGEIIDRNEFVADIYIKPSRSIRGITLNFIATRTGVAFTEISGG